jgi:hypothetical protein
MSTVKCAAKDQSAMRVQLDSSPLRKAVKLVSKDLAIIVSTVSQVGASSAVRDTS